MSTLLHTPSWCRKQTAPHAFILPAHTISIRHRWVLLLFLSACILLTSYRAGAQCAVTLTPTINQQPTCGGTEGYVTVAATGITLPYEFQLEKLVNSAYVTLLSGVQLAGNMNFPGLGAGSYRVTVSKDGACSTSTTFLLIEPALTLTPTNITQPTCGGTDGSFRVVAGGITTPYEFALEKLVNSVYVTQLSGVQIAGNMIFVGLSAGTYRVSVNKGGTCSGTVTVVLTQPTLTLTPTNVNHPTCGGNDGSFTVVAGGITTPYGFVLEKLVNSVYVTQLSGTQIAGNMIFVGLTAGTYRVSVNKGGTCSGSVTVVLTQPTLTLTPTNVNHPTCGGTDGSFTVVPGGITTPYGFVLEKLVNGVYVTQLSGTQIAGNMIFVGLSGGTYRVSVNKGGTCSGSVTVVLTQATLTLTQGNSQQPTCGGSDGYFTIVPGGITTPYGFVLEKLVSSTYITITSGTQIAGNMIFTGLSGGTYRVSVSKGGTCTGNKTVVLTEQTLTLTPGTIQQPTCGDDDGYITMVAGGITTPYQFSLDKEVNGSFVSQSSGTQIAGNMFFTGLDAGFYRVNVSKGSTCSGSETVLLLCPEVTGIEACGTGYWKNHVQNWGPAIYAPTHTLEFVFNVPNSFNLDNTTLLQALDLMGGNGASGAARILLRDAVAGLLNAAHPDVDYPLTSQQLITQVNAALASNKNAMLALALQLNNYNNLYCPIDALGNTMMVRGGVTSETRIANTLQLQALPNPSSGSFELKISGNANQKLSLRVVDMQGRLIEQRDQFSVNQSIRIGANYIPGVYLVEVEQGGERRQVKVVRL